MSDKPPVVNVSGISKELNYDFIDLSLKGERMTLRLADTKQKRYKGLSGVTKLEKNEGMLFSYPTEKRHRLVMRDMEIPLDVVHVGGDGKVNSYGSMSEDGEAVEGVSKWSIELPHGWCEKNDVEEGDPVYIKQPEGKEKLSKRRVYVEDPEDAPEGVNVEEGPQGGTFYETEEEGGEAADNPMDEIDETIDELMGDRDIVSEFDEAKRVVPEGYQLEQVNQPLGAAVVNFGEGTQLVDIELYDPDEGTVMLRPIDDPEATEQFVHEDEYQTVSQDDVLFYGEVNDKVDEFGRPTSLPELDSVETPDTKFSDNIPTVEVVPDDINDDPLLPFKDAEFARDYQEEAFGQLREVGHSDDAVEDLKKTVDSWADRGYARNETVWAAAMSMAGQKTLPTQFDTRVSKRKIEMAMNYPETIEAMGDLMRMSRQQVKDELADDDGKVELYRGVANGTLAEYAKHNDDGSVTIRPQVLESWSVSEDFADSWTDGGSNGVVIKQKVDADKVGFYGPFALGMENAEWQEITLLHDGEGETYTIPAEDIQHYDPEQYKMEKEDEPLRMLPSDASDWMRSGNTKEKILKSLEAAFKGRRYVNDPSEAPDDVEVQEGPQGGHFYETEGGEEEEEAQEGSDEPEGLPEYDSDDPQWVEVDEGGVDVGDVVMVWDDDEWERSVATVTDTGGMSVTVEYESGETDTIDQLGLFEDLSIQSQFVEGRTEEEAEAEEDPFHDKPWDSEEEREQILEEQKEERLEAVDYYDIPDPESGESSGVNIPTEVIGNQEPNDFGNRAEEEDVQTLEETIESGSLGEELGVNVNISEIPDDTPFGDSDFGKPNQDDPYVDVAIDTEDYLNLQFELQHKYFPSGQDYEEHRRNFFGNVRVDDIEEYAKTLREEPGEMDYPYMFTRNDGSVGSAQEGRHRALAAWKAGVDKIPVRVILDADKEPSEKMVDKARRYVQDPSEVPEGYEVQEGPQGGTYYETGESDEEPESEGGESDWDEVTEDMGYGDFDGKEILVDGEVYTASTYMPMDDYVSVQEDLTGDEPGYTDEGFGGFKPEAIDGVRDAPDSGEDESEEPEEEEVEYDLEEWSDPPENLDDLNDGQKLLVETDDRGTEVVTVNWAAEDIVSTFDDEYGEPVDITDTDDILGVSGEGHGTRMTPEEADEPTEMIDSIPFYGDAERLEDNVKEYVETNTENVKDPETAKRILNHIEQFEAMPGRAHVDFASGNSSERAALNVGSSGSKDTINHEFGHMALDAHGFGIGSFAAREAMTQYDPEEDNFIDLDGSDEDYHITQQEDEVEPTPEIERLAEKVNEGWQRLQENGAEEADRYNIKSNYSSANAHEFIAELHEDLQRKALTVPEGEVSWFDNHPGLLDAYLDVFEPSESMKQVIGELHERRGDDSPFDEHPFADDNKSAKSVRKRRVYVQDSSEVPEQYEAQEGPQGGIYYETEPEPEEEEVTAPDLPEGEVGPPSEDEWKDIDPQDLEEGDLVWVDDGGSQPVLAEVVEDPGTERRLAYPVREGDGRSLNLTAMGGYDAVGYGTEADVEWVMEDTFEDIVEGDTIIWEDEEGNQYESEVTMVASDRLKIPDPDGIGSTVVYEDEVVGTWEDVMGDTDIEEDDLTGAEVVLDNGTKGYVLNGESDSLHMELLTGPNAGEDIYGISRGEVENLVEPPEVDVDDTHEAIDFSDVDTDEWVQDESYPYQSIKVYDRADGEVKEGFVHYENYEPQRGKAEGQIEGGGEDGRFTIGDSNRFDIVTVEDFDKLDRKGKFDAVINYVRETERKKIGHTTANKFEENILGRNYNEGSLTRAKDWDTINRVARGMDYLKNKVSRASCGGSASKGTWHINISEDESDDTIAHELGHAIATSFGFDYIGENQNEEYGPRMLSHNYTQYSDTGSWSGFIDWDLSEGSEFYDVEEYMFSWFDDASDGTVDNDYAVGFDEFKEAVDKEIEETYNEGGLVQQTWQEEQYEEPDEDATPLQVLDSISNGDLVRFNVPDWDKGRDENGDPVDTTKDYAKFSHVEDKAGQKEAVFVRSNGDTWRWGIDSDGQLFSDWSSIDGISIDPDVSGDESEDDTDSGSGGIPQDPDSLTEYLGHKYEGGFNPDAESSEEKMENLARAVNRAFYKQAKVHDATDASTDRQKVVMETGYSATNAHETIAQLHEVLQTPTESNKQRADDIFEEHPYLILAYMDMWEPSPEIMEEMSELLQALGIEI